MLNLSPKCRPIESGDKIGRVTYKSPPIFCRLIKSAHKIGFKIKSDLEKSEYEHTI